MRDERYRRERGLKVNREISFQERLRPFYVEAFEILVQRQAAYGPENILQAGEWGVFEQLRNKVSRAANRLNGQVVGGKVILDADPGDQVLRDSLIDLMNYAAILLALREGLWESGMILDDQVKGGKA